MTMISHGMTMGGPFTKGRAGHSSKSCGNNTTWSDKGCCSPQHYTTWTDLKRKRPKKVEIGRKIGRKKRIGVYIYIYTHKKCMCVCMYLPLYCLGSKIITQIVRRTVRCRARRRCRRISTPLPRPLASPTHCPVPCARPPPRALPVQPLCTALVLNNAGSIFCCSCFLRLPLFLKLLVLHA